MTWHREWWQTAIELVLMIAMSVGFGMVVVAIRGSRRVKLTVAQRQRMGISGGLALGLGVLGYAATTDVRKPIARPAPASASASASVTDHSFESAAPPSVKIEAPPNWQLSFDESTRRLALSDGRTVLVIFTRRLESPGTPSGVREEVRKQLVAAGIAPVDFEESIDGKPALGLYAQQPDAATASWAIDRGGDVVTIAQCRTAKDGDARVACRPALERLRFVTPAR